MKILTNPAKRTWAELCQRPQLELDFLDSSVRNILNRVRKSGDEALKALTLQYDKAELSALQVSHEEIQNAVDSVPSSLKRSIQTAASNIEAFHQAQARETLVVETMPGVTCWRKSVPIEKVGIYIPGGSAPLFSTVLMLGIPARIAGCKEVVLCTPPDETGAINSAILFAAQSVGITSIFKVGGAQAIAALAFGTATIPSVHKIFGPGNQYVTKAKQIVSQEGVAIDLPAGPSEVLVVADHTANPSFLAADLLSQAEHGIDSQVVFATTEKGLQARVSEAIEMQLAKLPRKDTARGALQNSLSLQFDDMKDLIDFVNAYAPEHLIVNTRNSEDVADQIFNAGSIFVGPYSPESAGDYASGTNHTLPTNGYAKAYGGVALESFQKQITVQKISKDGLMQLGPAVIEMAEAEQLKGHAEAIRVRISGA